MSDATLEKRFSAFLSEAPDALHVMHSFDFGRFDAGKPFGSRVSRLRPTLYYVLSGLLHLQCTGNIGAHDRRLITVHPRGPHGTLNCEPVYLHSAWDRSSPEFSIVSSQR